MSSRVRTIFAKAFLALPLFMAGCAALDPAESNGPPPALEDTTTKSADVLLYLETLDRLAPGDTTRQATELAITQAGAQQFPTASNRLRYALALGAAGHPASNPVEAKRLIAELLAGPHDLRTPEISLANAYLREFDARVGLYADLSRQREEAERKLHALDADRDKKYAGLNGETQRLRKALAEAEKKLEAVAEMERSLIEDVPPDSPPPN